MGMFDRLKGLFKRKKRIDELLDESKELPPLPKETLIPKTDAEAQKIMMDSVRAKLDLILTELDNIKTQNQMMNSRLREMEKTLADMRGIRYY